MRNSSMCGLSYFFMKFDEDLHWHQKVPIFSKILKEWILENQWILVRLLKEQEENEKKKLPKNE